jgi:restriction system protein
MEVRLGEVEVSYSQRGNPTYRVEIWHDGLKKHRLIKGSEIEVIERKAQLQAGEWMAKWEQTQAREAARVAREGQKAQAAERTEEAQAQLEGLQGTLAHTLSVDDAIDWEQLKDSSQFSEPRPAKPRAPKSPPKPTRDDPAFSFLDRFVSSWREAKEARAAAMYENAHNDWLQETSRLKERHEKKVRKFDADLAAWEHRKQAFDDAQEASNEAIDRQRAHYEDRQPGAIEEYYDIVLSRSTYPDWMPQEFDLCYTPDNETLLVCYSLPSVDALPRLQQVTYVQSRDEFREKKMPDTQVRKLYDSLVYQIALRTVHEVFESDQLGAVESVVFNGYVTSVDPSTGLSATACILSLQTNREEFLEINLAQVDPKACFKALKGVGSSKLHSLTPIAPIMELRRDDGRFVSAREVTNTLDDSVNLATMDWEDFEHLIRELFEQEFRSGGGEVRVTQASRDGGVDAVAFDPDPIRGGKIVIQAKRYTNTVGVAAVRDLYGTVVNEGATKGILVTTSDYGPDAYGFAKDKPLVLMNGANLLHLLEKHGHRAQIDIQQAREQL